MFPPIPNFSSSVLCCQGPAMGEGIALVTELPKHMPGTLSPLLLFPVGQVMHNVETRG